MVQITTALTCLISFLGTAILAELYFKKHKPSVSLVKVVLGYIAVEFLLLTFVVCNWNFLLLLIGGTIAYATFICVYFRHRPTTSASLY